MANENGKKDARPLLNILHEVQEQHGYISEHMLKQIAVEQGIPIARLYGVVKFYTMFHTEPQGKYMIEICGSPSCVLNNGMRLEKFLENEIGAGIGETSKDGMFSLYKVSCIGCCDEAPAMLINGEPHTKMTVERLRLVLAKLREAEAKKADEGKKK
ncbi:MAG: NAD(P)H-dependent oxidoreductase subunit E [Candidatus Micrarchaeota archaeon]|nr:NAD(P)H-dependent oxidoreductase subunit E [Candidatus Micrarchaeota archaeon]